MCLTTKSTLNPVKTGNKKVHKKNGERQRGDEDLEDNTRTIIRTKIGNPENSKNK